MNEFEIVVFGSERKTLIQVTLACSSSLTNFFPINNWVSALPCRFDNTLPKNYLDALAALAHALMCFLPSKCWLNRTSLGIVTSQGLQ